MILFMLYYYYRLLLNWTVLRLLTQISPFAGPTKQSWWSAHFSSCIQGLLCLECCYDWKKTYSWIQVWDSHSIGGNTLIFHLTKREQYHSLIILCYKYISTSNLGKKRLVLCCFDTRLLKMCTVKVLHIIHASNLGSYYFSSIWILH